MGSPSIGASGDVAFRSVIQQIGEGIFLDSGGTDLAVALSGETAPGTGGGTYLSFGDPRVNGPGEVAFHATVQGGTVSEGIFLVPEPGGTAQLLAGIFLLAALGRLRSHRPA